MAGTLRTNMRVHIGTLLRQDIAFGKLKPGDCLPPIKTLAERFGTSISPVHQAFRDLEKEGLVDCRIGDGTFVTDLRPIANPLDVALVASLRAHVYGDLAGILLDKLHQLRIYPVTINAEHDNGEALLRNAVPAAKVLILIQSGGFSEDTLKQLSQKGKRLISILGWEQAPPEIAHLMWRVLADNAQGGRLVAEHLWSRGCRRVVVLGTNTMVDNATDAVLPWSASGTAFAGAWRERGGELRVLAGNSVPGATDPTIDAGDLLSRMRETTRPTGVFGLRDFEAWQAQDILLNDARHRFDKVPIIGYGNTPWSQAARPPLSTVDWNLNGIAAEACRLIEAAVTNTLGEPECHVVAPRLIVR